MSTSKILKEGIKNPAPKWKWKAAGESWVWTQVGQFGPYVFYYIRAVGLSATGYTHKKHHDTFVTLLLLHSLLYYCYICYSIIVTCVTLLLLYLLLYYCYICYSITVTFVTLLLLHLLLYYCYICYSIIVIFVILLLLHLLLYCMYSIVILLTRRVAAEVFSHILRWWSIFPVFL